MICQSLWVGVFDLNRMQVGLASEGGEVYVIVGQRLLRYTFDVIDDLLVGHQVCDLKFAV